MASVKKQIIDIVNQQPEDNTYDEILRELAMACMLERGMGDSDKGRVIGNTEMGRRIRSWQK